MYAQVAMTLRATDSNIKGVINQFTIPGMPSTMMNEFLELGVRRGDTLESGISFG